MSIKSNNGFTYCIAVYNEEANLLKNVHKINQGIKRLLDTSRYEILIVNNGSTDNTANIIKKIKNLRVRYINIEKKGIGLAFREGIKNANYDFVALCPIDLPFGFSDFVNAYPMMQEKDIVFASKAHPQSVIFRPFMRKVASVTYEFVVGLLFNTGIKDPQGTVFLKKRKILKILKHCDSDNAFFYTQLAIYSKRYKLCLYEVPIKMNPSNMSRVTKFSVITDGAKLIRESLREYVKLHFPYLLSVRRFSIK